MNKESYRKKKIFRITKIKSPKVERLDSETIILQKKKLLTIIIKNAAKSTTVKKFIYLHLHCDNKISILLQLMFGPFMIFPL